MQKGDEKRRKKIQVEEVSRKEELKQLCVK